MEAKAESQGPEAAEAVPAAAPAAALTGLARLEEAPFAWRLAPSLVLGLAVGLAVLLFYPSIFLRATELVVLYAVTPLGQEAWLILGHNAPFSLSYGFVAFLLWSVSAAQVLFVALVLPVDKVMARLGRLGRRVVRFEAKVRASRFASTSLALALAVVVALPIHLGGALVGTFAGRLLGLRWHQTAIAVMAAVTLRFALALLAVLGVTKLAGG